MTDKAIEERIDRLQAGGIIDMHFDLPMDLYEKRERENVIAAEFRPELQAGNIGVVGVAIYIEDRYLPDAGLRVALDQIARLYAETQACPQCAICKSYRDIENALKEDKIALLITMEGAEPLGTDFVGQHAHSVGAFRMRYDWGIGIFLTNAVNAARRELDVHVTVALP